MLELDVPDAVADRWGSFKSQVAMGRWSVTLLSCVPMWGARGGRSQGQDLRSAFTSHGTVLAPSPTAVLHRTCLLFSFCNPREKYFSSTIAGAIVIGSHGPLHGTVGEGDLHIFFGLGNQVRGKSTMRHTKGVLKIFVMCWSTSGRLRAESPTQDWTHTHSHLLG